MDYSTPLEEYHDHIATLKCAALWFLGDCVDFFNAANQGADCTPMFQAILVRLQKMAVMGDWKVMVAEAAEA